MNALIGKRVLALTHDSTSRLWPAKSSVRFVGTLVAQTPDAYVLRGKWQIFKECPNPPPPDWPTEVVERVGWWPWSKPEQVRVPLRATWWADAAEETTVLLPVGLTVIMSGLDWVEEEE